MSEFELRIPVAKWLLSRDLKPVFETCQNCDIVGVRFTKPKTLVMAVAVELKLHDINTAMWQAIHHRSFAHECWIAMPTDRFRRLRRSIWRKVICGGLGVLGIDGDGTEELCSPLVCHPPNVEKYVSRLWRRRDEYQDRMKNPLCFKYPRVQEMPR